MLTFAHPWLLILLPLPWLLRRLLPPRRANRAAIRVPFGDRLRRISGGEKSAATVERSARHFVVPLLLWIILLAALARPQWLEPPITKQQPTRDLLLLVDLSGSMKQEDFTNAEGKTVDRLTAVKEVLGDFLEHREGDRVGLVVFGDAAFLQAPFSTDLSLSRRLLDETVIGMAGPRTAFGDAIGLGIAQFDASEAPAKTIIALTDGNDTASQVPPVEAARIAGQRGIRIHTVAIGDPTTAGEEKLDEATLKATAKAANGSYFFAADRKALAGIYEELDRIETREIKVVSHRPLRDLFPWLLLAALAVSFLDKAVATWRASRGVESPASVSGTVRVHPLSGKLEVSG
ncbi:MAG: VWA domain-containing protein [Verrucomicrobiae bacterium]|nr:VWA domain-containing protein [Verrucomicrobiae bacterium]